MLFTIYHPVEGNMNYGCEPGLLYEEVATIEADDLDEAYLLSQNDFNEAYCSKGHRSTSVGDIIATNNEYHVVMGFGFREVSEFWFGIRIGILEYNNIHPEQLAVCTPYVCRAGTFHEHFESCICTLPY